MLDTNKKLLLHEHLLSHLDLSDLADDAMTDLVAHSRLLDLHRKETVFSAGEPVDDLWIVVEGELKLVVTAPNGSEKVVEIIQSGQSFGEALVFLRKSSPVTAIALKSTRLMAVSRRGLMEAMGHSPRIAERLLVRVSSRLFGLVRDMELCCLRSGMERVVGFLIAEVMHMEDRSDIPEIRLKSRKNLIASRLNLAPESFSRILKSLVEQGVILIEGNLIRILDMEALHGMDC